MLHKMITFTSFFNGLDDARSLFLGERCAEVFSPVKVQLWQLCNEYLSYIRKLLASFEETFISSVVSTY